MSNSSGAAAPMDGRVLPDPLTDEIRLVIRTKARRLVARGGIPVSEAPDVEQTLTAAVLQARQSYRADRGPWVALAKTAVDRCGHNVLRRSFAQKRNHRGVVSLQVQVAIGNHEGATELSQLITADDDGRRRRASSRDLEDAAALRMDVSELIAMLPYDLRELAQALRSENLYQIAERTRIPRSTLYDQLSRLRQVAQDVGLAEYLE